MPSDIHRKRKFREQKINNIGLNYGLKYMSHKTHSFTREIWQGSGRDMFYEVGSNFLFLKVRSCRVISFVKRVSCYLEIALKIKRLITVAARWGWCQECQDKAWEVKVDW